MKNLKIWTLVLMAAMASMTMACGSAAEEPAPGSVTAGAADGTDADGAIDKVVNAAKAIVAPRYREVTLPVGTTLRLELTSAVGSDTSSVEDAVRAELRQPVEIDGATVLPAGTELAGVVTGAERSGRVKGRARVAYRFNSLSVASERYDIQTAPLSHLAPATKGEDATKIAIGAGAGAAIGALLGGGDGAAKGAAVGGGAGTGVVLATRGKEISVGPGADVNTRLTAPLTVRVRVE